MDYYSCAIGFIVAAVIFMAVVKYNPRGYRDQLMTMANKESYTVYGIKDRSPVFNGPER
jgi:hypothetical protein